jgi:hypothetical protein
VVVAVLDASPPGPEQRGAVDDSHLDRDHLLVPAIPLTRRSSTLDLGPARMGARKSGVTQREASLAAPRLPRTVAAAASLPAG